MKFYSKEPALQVLITESKFCVFKQHFYETEDADEIEVLLRTKGVKVLEDAEDSGLKDSSQTENLGALKNSEASEKTDFAGVSAKPEDSERVETQENSQVELGSDEISKKKPVIMMQPSKSKKKHRKKRRH